MPFRTLPLSFPESLPTPSTGPNPNPSPDRTSDKREEADFYPGDKLLLYLVNDNFPNRWIFKDFGPLAIRYYRDQNADRRRDRLGKVVATVGGCATALTNRGTMTNICRDGHAASRQPIQTGAKP